MSWDGSLLFPPLLFPGSRTRRAASSRDEQVLQGARAGGAGPGPSARRGAPIDGSGGLPSPSGRSRRAAGAPEAAGGFSRWRGRPPGQPGRPGGLRGRAVPGPPPHGGAAPQDARPPHRGGVEPRRGRRENHHGDQPGRRAGAGAGRARAPRGRRSPPPLGGQPPRARRIGWPRPGQRDPRSHRSPWSRSPGRVRHSTFP